MLPMSYYLVLSALLFGVGILGVLIRRNALVIFMSIELMLNAVNLTFITFSVIGVSPRTDFVIFCYDCGGGRSSCGAGHYHAALPQLGDSQHRRYQFDEVVRRSAQCMNMCG